MTWDHWLVRVNPIPKPFVEGRDRQRQTWREYRDLKSGTVVDNRRSLSAARGPGTWAPVAGRGTLWREWSASKGSSLLRQTKSAS